MNPPTTTSRAAQLLDLANHTTDPEQRADLHLQAIAVGVVELADDTRRLRQTVETIEDLMVIWLT